MAFTPYLINVDFDDSINTVNLTVEHRDTGITITRVYIYILPMTLSAMKNDVLSRNTNLNNRPAVVASLQGLIGSQIQ